MGCSKYATCFKGNHNNNNNNTPDFKSEVHLTLGRGNLKKKSVVKIHMFQRKLPSSLRIRISLGFFFS